MNSISSSQWSVPVSVHVVRIRGYQNSARLGSVSGNRGIEVLDLLPFLLGSSRVLPCGAESLTDFARPREPLKFRSQKTSR